MKETPCAFKSRSRAEPRLYLVSDSSNAASLEALLYSRVHSSSPRASDEACVYHDYHRISPRQQKVLSMISRTISRLVLGCIPLRVAHYHVIDCCPSLKAYPCLPTPSRLGGLSSLLKKRKQQRLPKCRLLQNSARWPLSAAALLVSDLFRMSASSSSSDTDGARQILTHSAVCGWTFRGQLLSHHREHIQQGHQAPQSRLRDGDSRHGGSSKRSACHTRIPNLQIPKTASCSDRPF